MNARALGRVLLWLGLCLSAGAGAGESPDPSREWRILHVMSFDSPWRWTDGQFAGFKAGLGEDLKVQYRVFQMDIKHHSSLEAKERKGQEARALIDAWRPDLVYTSDDDAQSHVTRHYVNQPLPFVFSGVNKDPAAHGLEGARNVTGVLEQEHFPESVRLLQALVPNARRLAVLSDDMPHWTPVIARVRAGMARLPDTQLVAVDQVKTYAEFQARVDAYPVVADAVLYLGIFGLQGADGQNVPYQEVQAWVAQHSRLPDISFWIDRVHHGTLASVTVSEREQGLAAGRLARAILVDGVAPNSLPIQPTLKGHPAINLARAHFLGLKVNASLLLSAEVMTRYAWQ